MSILSSVVFPIPLSPIMHTLSPLRIRRLAWSKSFLAPKLFSGDLVEVLGDWQQPFSGPFLYYPSRRHMPAPLRAFVDFVKGG